MTPALSVILLVPGSFSMVARTLRALRAQSAAERLELVVVAADRGMLGPEPDELRAFARVQIVESWRFQATGQARAEGIRAASAAVVALAEDHSYPEPSWAEALIEAHRQDWAVVGPAMRNANPLTSLSWAGMLADFSPWLHPAPAGEVPGLPSHSSSYKRAPLLQLGERLGTLLNVESLLQQELRRRGGRLYLEPRAITHHVNVSRPRSWLEEHLASGWLYGAERAQADRWSPARRVVYTLGSPLIPAVRLRRIAAELRRPGRPLHLFPRVLPALALSLVLHSAGEARGYTWGVGEAAARKSRLEFCRERHVDRRDLAAIQSY